MLASLLFSLAVEAKSVEFDETQTHYRLITKKLGATVILARIEKEQVYQMVRTPDMPETFTETSAQQQPRTSMEEPRIPEEKRATLRVVK